MHATRRQTTLAVLALFVCLSFYVHSCFAGNPNKENTQTIVNQQGAETFFRKGGNHTNNWAVLVSTSRFWFNYRHSANALSIYRTVKRMGLGDDHIILMLADDMACDTRNSFAGTVFNNQDRRLNLYGDNIEVDYRGYDVTVENFIRLLTGRQDESVPRSKRLMSDAGSNILIFLTGHGGDEFIKFQDAEEISSQDIADAIEQMRIKSRYNEILFMADTCQATTLYSHVYSPNFLGIGSSGKGENSYSHHADDQIGVSVIDRFTYHTLEFLERVQPDSNMTVGDLFRYYDPRLLGSNAAWSTALYARSIDKVYLTEFFGSSSPIELTQQRYLLEGATDSRASAKDSISSKAAAQASLTARNQRDSYDSSEFALKERELVFFDTNTIMVAATFLAVAIACSRLL